MMYFIHLLDDIFLGNTYREWLTSAAIAVAIVSVLLLVRLVLVNRLEAFAKHTATDVDDLAVELLKRTKLFFIVAIGLWIALHNLDLPTREEKPYRTYIDLLFNLVFFIQASIWAGALVAYWVKKFASRSSDGQGNAAIISAMGAAVRVVVVVALFLFFLNNVVNVTPLIAGLGIGGIAVALAVQNILGDLFGAVSILVDKPFQVGDFIAVDNMKGTVEHIGMKSTRVRGLGGEQIIFSNADLLRSRVSNFKRMLERRVAFTTGVVYQTEPEKLQRVPTMIREIVETQSPVRFERCHFLKFAESWLEFETVYWVLTPDYMTFANIQQTINLEIFRRFNAEGIDFAYPTTQLRIERGKEEENPLQ